MMCLLKIPQNRPLICWKETRFYPPRAVCAIYSSDKSRKLEEVLFSLSPILTLYRYTQSSFRPFPKVFVGDRGMERE